MLKPTLREKKHYLAIEILSKLQLDASQTRDFIDKSVSDYLGYQAPKAGLKIIELKTGKSSNGFSIKGILSVERKMVLHVRSALILIKEINNSSVLIRVIGVSGTIKKLREKFLSK